MKDTNVEVKKESNAILSKLSEDQFNELRQMMDFIQQLSSVNLFDGFYPNLNTELLTRIREVFNLMKRVKSFKNDLTEDEFISIVKDYGSVSHYRDEVRVITKVKVSLPEPEELFPEKMVA